MAKRYWENEGAPDANGNYCMVIDPEEEGQRASRYKGKSREEVYEKVADAQQHATEKFAKQRREGIQLRTPDRAAVTVPQPRKLNADETFDIATRLNTAGQEANAITEAVEAAIGVPLATLSKAVESMTKPERDAYYEAESVAFVEENPDYYVHPQNLVALFNYLQAHGLDLTRNNLAIAFRELSNRNLLLQEPEEDEDEEADEQEPKPTPSTPREDPSPQPRPRKTSVSTGFRTRDASGEKPAPKAPARITRAEIDAMPRHEYAQKMADPSFRRQVDALK